MHCCEENWLLSDTIAHEYGLSAVQMASMEDDLPVGGEPSFMAGFCRILPHVHTSSITSSFSLDVSCLDPEIFFLPHESWLGLGEQGFGPCEY